MTTLRKKSSFGTPELLFMLSVGVLVVVVAVPMLLIFFQCLLGRWSLQHRRRAGGAAAQGNL
jgi:hypothetical protein